MNEILRKQGYASSTQNDKGILRMTCGERFFESPSLRALLRMTGIDDVFNSQKINIVSL